LQPSADAIGRAVATLLRGDPTTLGSAGGRDAYPIGIAALLSGTGPLLGRWVEEGSLDVSDPVASVLARHLSHGRMRADRLAREVAPALNGLVAAGVQPMVIKGFHTAYEYFPEPGVRPISDVDTVVAPERVPRAEEALQAVGFNPSPFATTPYKRDWYPPDDDKRIWSVELFDERDRWKLELHDDASFCDLPTFGVRLNAGLGLQTRPHPHAPGVRTPAQPLLTAILATHLAAELHMRCLLRTVEIVFVVRRDRELGLLDWNALEAFLDESCATRFAYPALALVEKVAPGTIDAGLLSRARRASTRLTRFVADRVTPTFPILDRFILAERLMWIANGRQAIQSLANWINPAAGRPLRETLKLYHSRLVRLLAGRASWTPDASASNPSSPGRRPGAT
jgi:hypothetical protein